MIKSIAVSASANGNNELVAAVTGRRIRVLGWVLAGAGTVAAKFTDGAGGTDLTGAMSFVAGASQVAQINPEVPGGYLPWLETSPGTALVLNLSTNVAVNGVLLYELRY